MILRTQEGIRINQVYLSLFAVLVGIVAGFGAIIFRWMIALIHNLAFLGKFSFIYDANVHTPLSAWGPYVILIPVIGAIVVVFLVKNFAPEAKGHGVPEVMDAIYYNDGKIRPVVSIVKSIASSVSIGTGGAVGREGPIVQIGSSFGSSIGQIFHLAPQQTITLVACGAAGGIAATFNTPLGGILFAIELILPEFSARTFIPVAISTAVATFISTMFLGSSPAFIVPPYSLGSPIEFIFYVGLGVFIGASSVIFIDLLYRSEDFFESLKMNDYTRHTIGMLFVGVLGYLFMKNFHHYYILGVGYSTVSDILVNVLTNPVFLFALVLSKLLVTSITLGSGGSGGIFSPSLFMGAAIGGMYGTLLNHMFPQFITNPAAYAIVGMSGMVGGATGATVTAVVMTFEMTRNYHIILPIIITAAVADAIRRALCSDSIYTRKLARRGHSIPDVFQMNILMIKRVKEVMNKKVITVTEDESIMNLLTDYARTDVMSFIITDSNREKIKGIVTLKYALGVKDKNTPISSIVKKDFVTAKENEMIFTVLAKMTLKNSPGALITKTGKCEHVSDVIGVLPKERIVTVLAERLRLFY